MTLAAATSSNALVEVTVDSAAATTTINILDGEGKKTINIVNII